MFFMSEHMNICSKNFMFSALLVWDCGLAKLKVVKKNLSDPLVGPCHCHVTNFVLHSELFHVIPHGSGRASECIYYTACNVMPARSPATTALQGGASGQAVWLG